jgi:hypothetical protein
VKKLKREKVKMVCRNTIARKINLLTFALFLLAPFSFLSAQSIKVDTRVAPAPVKKINRNIRGISRESSPSAEKSIAVDAKVKVSLHVCEGKLKINGWDRSEIRAFVTGGSGVGFRVQQKVGQNDSPVWVKILGSDPAKNKEGETDLCLSGDEIEIDVPRGATVDVKGSESKTSIDSVRKAAIEIYEGDIFLNNIKEGINAKTFEGGITVGNSSGMIMLVSTTGNIAAFSVSPSEIGDVLKARTTSGAVVLQRVEHRQTEVSSNSGSVKFIGAFQNGGQYILRTQNGSISLAVPEKSSFKLNASFGFGAFDSEIPLENFVKTNTARAANVSATLGKAEATLVLITSSGAIRLKRQ